MNFSKVKQQGFTIVELLIVVVVIGILAAIVIVAYNGVTNSAKSSAWKSDAQNLAKIAEVVNARTGSYPSGANDAALTTSFNSTDTAKIPSGITIKRVTNVPTNASASTDAENKTYNVEPCTGGLYIYYPVAGASGNAETITIGTPTSCP